MNRYIKTIPASLIACSMLFTACDDVKESDRLIDFPLPPQGSRTLVIMEFTGQNCTNCPDGATIMNSIHQTLGDGMISVNLHPEGTTFTQQMGPVKLTSQIATDYLQYFNTSQFPYAVFNNRATDYSASYQNWTKIIDDESINVRESRLRIKVEPLATFDASSGNVTVECSVTSELEAASGLNVNVWILENGIVAPQKTSNGVNRNYVHNHVARTSLTGAWGTAMAEWIPVESDGNVNYEYEGVFTGSFDSTWVPENCEILVFVTNPANGNEIMQGKKCSLVEAAGAEQ